MIWQDVAGDTGSIGKSIGEKYAGNITITLEDNAEDCSASHAITLATARKMAAELVRLADEIEGVTPCPAMQ